MSAGASAADVRSILSIPGPSGSQTPGAPTTPGGATPVPSAAKVRKVRPEGISRELFALIGPSVPTLSAQLSKPKFKPKPKNLSGGGKAVKWEWREFTNPARKDNLKLGHWTKASTDPSAEYPFAKYNIQPQSYTYSFDEYQNFLQEEGWTKEETDYLFNIVQEYDLRFFVIADRYNFPGGPPRTIEDLKDRYYGVCRRLIRNRPWPGDEAGKAQALAAVSYDKEREMNRKAYIASLESRTKEEIIEEEALFLELKRLEQSERNFARDRDELLRVFEGIESGLLSITERSLQDEEEFAFMVGDSKSTSKKRKGAMDDSPISSGPGIGVPATPVKKIRSAKEIAQDALHCIHRTDVTGNSSAATKAAHQPVYLRSYKIPVPRSSQQQRVAQVLSELGLRHDRLVMPTLENCQQLEQLLSAAAALVETKKVVDRVDHEIRVLRARLAEKEGTAGGEEGGADGERGDNGDRMDVDENGEDDPDADADGETDRAVSQAPSARSSVRKGVKRSGSVSSMASSTTAGTRATSRKRQRS